MIILYFQNFIYYLTVTLHTLVVIKERTKLYHLHGVSDEDVPVVPAGAIVLKYSITSFLFSDLALLARHRIHFCVLSTGFSRSAGVSCRHSWNRTTISLGSFDWVWMHWRTSGGRARDISENVSNMLQQKNSSDHFYKLSLSNSLGGELLCWWGAHGVNNVGIRTHRKVWSLFWKASLTLIW